MPNQRIRSSSRLVSFAVLALGALAGCTPFDSVEDAFAAPTGNVTPSSMRELVRLAGEIARAMPALEAITLPRPALGVPEACRTGTMDSATYDLACMTAGRMTGSLVVDGDARGYAGEFRTFDTFTYENVCTLDVCVSGTWEVSSGFSETVEIIAVDAIDVDVTHGGETTHTRFGRRAGDDPLSEEGVIFNAKGASFRLDHASFVHLSGAERDSYGVSGANGTFRCALTAGGGACVGPQSFDF